MVAVDIQPCPTWNVSYSECDTLGPEQCWSPDSQLIYERMAAEYLWNWTGRVFGLCTVVLRPCRIPCPPVGGEYGTVGSGFAYGPQLIGGSWYNIACGRCGDICSCGGTAPLRLPGPVDAITTITIDGVVLPEGSYRVDNYELLVRVDGYSWPLCQNMSLNPGEVGTWEIMYERGAPVPVGGQVAAGALAVELAKAACGDNTCQLPRRVQSITRQGVTVAILDAFDDVDKGRTGVWLIDSWIASVTQPRRGGSVRSVDVPHPRHRVTTWPLGEMPIPGVEPGIDGGGVGGGGPVLDGGGP